MLHPQVLLVPLRELLVPLQAPQVPVQVPLGPELELQLLALLRVPRERLVLVEILALLRLPRPPELQLLLLERLCSLPQLLLQQRRDYLLGHLRTLQHPLVEVDLPVHPQLGRPRRLQGHHLRRFPRP